MADLGAFDVLTAPRPALRPREGIADGDATAWELMYKLREQGWTGKLLPAKVKGQDSLPAPFDPGDPNADRVWYYRRGAESVGIAYMRCLLSGDAVVSHVGTAKYYDALGGGEKLAIGDDAGAAGGDRTWAKNASCAQQCRVPQRAAQGG
eukprot:1699863-Pyramimonas_sp.AAC.1